MSDANAVELMRQAARGSLRAIRRMHSCLKRYDDDESAIIEIYNQKRYWSLSVLRESLMASERPKENELPLRNALKKVQVAFRELYDWMERDEYATDPDGDDWDEPPYQMDEIAESIRKGWFEQEVEKLKSALAA